MIREIGSWNWIPTLHCILINGCLMTHLGHLRGCIKEFDYLSTSVTHYNWFSLYTLVLIVLQMSSSMITVVEFRPKQATGSRYMPTNYFFIEIDLGWLELTKNWVWFQKIECFQNENNQKVSLIKNLLLILYSLMKKNRQNLADFDFENQKFTTFWVLQSIQINCDEKIISEHTYISTTCSLFGRKLHNCNHANGPFHLPVLF